MICEVFENSDIRHGVLQAFVIDHWDAAQVNEIFDALQRHGPSMRFLITHIPCMYLDWAQNELQCAISNVVYCLFDI